MKCQETSSPHRSSEAVSGSILGASRPINSSRRRNRAESLDALPRPTLMELGLREGQSPLLTDSDAPPLPVESR